MSREVAEKPCALGQGRNRYDRENGRSIAQPGQPGVDHIQIGNGSLPLYLVQETCNYTGYIVDIRFAATPSVKYHLHFICQEDRIVMDYDPDK
jgi:hypothetical protein